MPLVNAAHKTGFTIDGRCFCLLPAKAQPSYTTYTPTNMLPPLLLLLLLRLLHVCFDCRSA
jgi:hypothetical protein